MESPVEKQIAPATEIEKPVGPKGASLTDFMGPEYRLQDVLDHPQAETLKQIMSDSNGNAFEALLLSMRIARDLRGLNDQKGLWLTANALRFYEDLGPAGRDFLSTHANDIPAVTAYFRELQKEHHFSIAKNIDFNDKAQRTAEISTDAQRLAKNLFPMSLEGLVPTGLSGTGGSVQTVVNGTGAAMGVKRESLGTFKRGGIDLTPANMNLQTQNAGEGIRFHMDPAMIQQLQNTTGFVPVIINIQPLNNISAFLGLEQTSQSNAG